ncbi:hypothetical protein [Bacteroides oleiciplenus]|uniref:Uncharacterized protein n=1 Tax=Bacteroides oleiciplenus YIT 12058 TaxID=742727 RepID=K9EFE6_9BACE|nr:hypothetical protein [Bacteroides oleiciplenus]EKU87850.1 hypothetical protein HMPREF9447_04596 [Bacteroides oleiciplenus YIT 12058]
MKKVQSHRKTIRFRKWSRKAYAAFASLGQWVTIGCLPKGVADCSLSKQKAGAAAGCKSGEQSIEEVNGGKGQETDIGVPLGCENSLAVAFEIYGFKELGPVLCPIVNASQQGEKYTDIVINKSGTQMTRTTTNAVFQIVSSASSAFSIFP